MILTFKSKYLLAAMLLFYISDKPSCCIGNVVNTLVQQKSNKCKNTFQFVNVFVTMFCCCDLTADHPHVFLFLSLNKTLKNNTVLFIAYTIFTCFLLQIPLVSFQANVHRAYVYKETPH